MKKKKQYTVSYKCPYCNKESYGEVLSGSRLIKCGNANCGKYSDISLAKGLEEHKNKFEKIEKKNNSKNKITIIALIALLLMIPIFVIFVI